MYLVHFSGARSSAGAVARWKAMGRYRRCLLPGFPAHVTQRGNSRQRIFRCESDYRYMWRCLSEAVADRSVDIHAYVFMGNHIHLLMTPNTLDAIAWAMHSATRRYSGYFNTRYRRKGTLWEGPYRASRILSQEHFLSCYPYIDLNPVRAGLARRPEDYAWSSHRHYAFGESNSLIRPHEALTLLSTRGQDLSSAYREFVAGPVDPAQLDLIRVCTKAGSDMGEVPRRGRPPKTYVTPFY